MRSVVESPNKITAHNAGWRVSVPLRGSRSCARRVLSSSVSCDMKLHSVLLGWSES